MRANVRDAIWIPFLRFSFSIPTVQSISVVLFQHFQGLLLPGLKLMALRQKSCLKNGGMHEYKHGFEAYLTFGPIKVTCWRHLREM